MSFENLEGFMSEFSVNISTTGMFVRSSEPRPAGTMLGFQLSLADGQPLIRGHGEVVWVRRHDGGTEHPAGMGIRFVYDTDLDRLKIEQTVEGLMKEHLGERAYAKLLGGN